MRELLARIRAALDQCVELRGDCPCRKPTKPIRGNDMEPMASALDDECRWAELVARRLAGGLPPEMAEQSARVKLAVERRARWVHLRTWAPDDPEPDIKPDSVYDVRGARWLWQPWDKTWRMFIEDKRRYITSPEVPTSDQTWNELLLSSGPITERRASSN